MWFYFWGGAIAIIETNVVLLEGSILIEGLIESHKG